MTHNIAELEAGAGNSFRAADPDGPKWEQSLHLATEAALVRAAARIDPITRPHRVADLGVADTVSAISMMPNVLPAIADTRWTPALLSGPQLESDWGTVSGGEMLDGLTGLSLDGNTRPDGRVTLNPSLVRRSLDRGNVLTRRRIDLIDPAMNHLTRHLTALSLADVDASLHLATAGAHVVRSPSEARWTLLVMIEGAAEVNTATNSRRVPTNEGVWVPPNTGLDLNVLVADTTWIEISGSPRPELAELGVFPALAGAPTHADVLHRRANLASRPSMTWQIGKPDPAAAATPTMFGSTLPGGFVVIDGSGSIRWAGGGRTFELTERGATTLALLSAGPERTAKSAERSALPETEVAGITDEAVMLGLAEQMHVQRSLA